MSGAVTDGSPPPFLCWASPLLDREGLPELVRVCEGDFLNRLVFAALLFCLGARFPGGVFEDFALLLDFGRRVVDFGSRLDELQHYKGDHRCKQSKDIYIYKTLY